MAYSNLEKKRAREREKYRANPEYFKAKRKKFYQKNRDKIILWRKNYYITNRNNVKKAAKKYYEKHRNKILTYTKEYLQRRRLLVLEFYGGKPPRCACCGESEICFLSIDHIDGGGNKHRKEISGGKNIGVSLYQWLIKNDFPGGFQILCYNCNFSKGHYGRCPHFQK